MLLTMVAHSALCVNQCPAVLLSMSSVKTEQKAVQIPLLLHDTLPSKAWLINI